MQHPEELNNICRKEKAKIPFKSEELESGQKPHQQCEKFMNTKDHHQAKLGPRSRSFHSRSHSSGTRAAAKTASIVSTKTSKTTKPQEVEMVIQTPKVRQVKRYKSDPAFLRSHLANSTFRAFSCVSPPPAKYWH